MVHCAVCRVLYMGWGDINGVILQWDNIAVHKPFNTELGFSHVLVVVTNVLFVLSFKKMNNNIEGAALL